MNPAPSKYSQFSKELRFEEINISVTLNKKEGAG